MIIIRELNDHEWKLDHERILEKINSGKEQRKMNGLQKFIRGERMEVNGK